jgi:hypothetical protein
VRTLIVGTIVETPLLCDFSTRKILWLSLLNGRTSQHKDGLSSEYRKIYVSINPRDWQQGRYDIGETKKTGVPPKLAFISGPVKPEPSSLSIVAIETAALLGSRLLRTEVT